MDQEKLITNDNEKNNATQAAKPTKELTVTVIVPSYRRPAELVRCLQALEAQTRRPDQLVVTVRYDDTVNMQRLAEFKKSGTRLPLEVAIVETPGLIAAYNTGLKEAWGDIVCLTDDDAEPHPDWLEKLLRHYADPTVGGVGGRDLVHKEGGEIEDRLVDKVGTLNWFGRRDGNHQLTLKGGQPVEVFTLKGVNSSYRRKIMGEFDCNLRGLPETANEDDMGLKIIKQGYRLIYDPTILVDHFPSQVRPDARGPEAIFNKTQAYNENHNFTYVLLKHFSLRRQISFMLYNFLIGDNPNLALVRSFYGLVTTGNWRYVKILPTAYAGKLAGIRTYRRYLASLKGAANEPAAKPEIS